LLSAEEYFLETSKNSLENFDFAKNQAIKKPKAEPIIKRAKPTKRNTKKPRLRLNNSDQLGIESITERRFVGPCRDAVDYIRTLQHIENHRAEIDSLINDFHFLEENRKEAMVEYLVEFFEMASDQSQIFTSINSSCY